MSNGIEEVISKLYEMVQDAWSLPLGADKCVLERDKVLDLLDEINNQLPGEFKQAKTIVDARNEVITNARREAEAIQKQAEQKARQLLSEDAIVARAKEEATRLMNDTKAQAEAVVRTTQEKLEKLKAVTNSYVLDSLRETETAVERPGEVRGPVGPGEEGGPSAGASRGACGGGSRRGDRRRDG